MRIQRPSAARGQVALDWLDSRHTFSFGQYHDPAWMGFGPLRVINEDRVAAGAGFPPHAHANMEILTCVLSGALTHRDDVGGGGTISAGDVQWMSAGRGVEHSEFNASQSAPVHFLQVWIQPDRLNAAPAYALRSFDDDDAAQVDGWTLLASPDGARDSMAIRQQAWLHRARPRDGVALSFVLLATRRYWLHVAQGAAEVDGHLLGAGDALGISGEGGILQVVGQGKRSEVLLFDLPD